MRDPKELREAALWQIAQAREDRYGPRPSQALDDVYRFASQKGWAKRGTDEEGSADPAEIESYLLNVAAAVLASLEALADPG